MRIARLFLQNYRSFAAKSLEFVPGFNVLIGDNGTGKTAILDAIAVALDPIIYKAVGFPARTIRSDDVRRDRSELQFPVVIEATGVYRGAALTWKRTLSDKPNAKTTNRETKEIRAKAESLFKAMRANEPVVAPVISYFTTGRLWRQKREKLEKTVSPGSKLRGYDHCLDAEANDSFLFRWLKTAQLAAMQSVFETGSHYDPKVEAIRIAISECMEGGRRFLTFDIEQNEIIMASKGSDDRLPFRMLSDGQRNIAAMVLDIGYRCVTLNPHLAGRALEETPGIVLIDEIDLHLHPKWQRRVVDDLRHIFPKIQFIVTTHSPLIIQSLQAGELIDLGPEVDEEPEKYVGRAPEDILESV
jgi:predicted ATP-binding protein involved in virulence